VEIFVEVELVIVPLFTLIDGRDKLVTERLVMVAEVSVAFPPAMLAVAMFDVVELVVDAFKIAKLAEDPNSVAIVPLVAVRLVNIAVTAFNNEVYKLVDVAEVSVAFTAVKLVFEALITFVWLE
jgi:hypothetical protein